MINSNLWFGRRYASVGGNPAKIRSLSHCLQGDGTVTYPRWYRTSSNVMSCSLVLWKVESWLKTNKWLTCSSCCLDLFLKKISVLSIPIISCFYLIPPGNLNGDQNPNDSTWRTSARGNFISFWEQTWNGLETVKVGTVYLQSQMFHPLDTSPRLFCVSDCFQLDDENKAHQAGLGPYRDHVKFQDILYICSIPKLTRHVILGFPGDSPQLHPIRPSFQRHGLGPQYAAMSWNVSNQLQIKGTWNHLTGVIVSPPQTMYY